MVKETSAIWGVIQARLRELKQTQQWLADELGVSVNAVSKWKITGKISRKNAIRLSEKLGISLDRLLRAQAGIQPEAAQQITTADPTLNKVIAHFFWLTEEQKAHQLSKVKSMADANRVIAKQLGAKVRPVPNSRVEEALKSKEKRR